MASSWAQRPRLWRGLRVALSLDDQVVCRLVAACGGTVEAELSEWTTHLVFRTPDSES